MPKQATFQKIYPTLRKPLNFQQKSESHVTLRKRINTTLQSNMFTNEENER